jgi:hypothetical protein
MDCKHKWVPEPKKPGPKINGKMPQIKFLSEFEERVARAISLGIQQPLKLGRHRPIPRLPNLIDITLQDHSFLLNLVWAYQIPAPL